MAPRSQTGAAKRNRRRPRKGQWRFAPAVQRVAQACRPVLSAFLRAPRSVQVLVVVGVLLVAWLTSNWVYQAIRKPTELLSPLSGRLAKSLPETWEHYGSLFRQHSTDVITPELLAALAQVEGGGDPLARTYWEWRWTLNPFEWYGPASSAVGMYQITDGTFDEAKRLCIHDHVVMEDGPWYDFKSCWFNGLYTRTVPSHAIEMTAAWLDRNVRTVTERRRRTRATLKQKQNLAAVIHLCGAGAGDAYARRRFRLPRGERCGTHDVRAYLRRVNAMKREFVQLAAAD